ncbi:MAG: type II toxin-antitoxin system VapC family toxin [Anaerolineae bacterium]
MTVDALLDTNILIDLLRGSSDAATWMQSQTSTVFGIPVLVSMELVNGVENARERQQVQQTVAAYPVIHLTADDSMWAQTQHAAYKLSHNVGIIDALIAAPAKRLSVPIFTLNLKHFAPLPDVRAIKPY